MKKVIFWLILVCFLATILRLYQLGNVPIGLEWDEVALGYDAYSILRTGKDQFGKFLPLTFRSIDDYKPPLYVYANVPAVAFFGLSEFSTRLPSAIFGVIAVILTYYLVLEIFRDRSKVERHLLALLSSLFLAISPWHLQFSRAAFEANLSVTITIAAVLFFLKGISGKVKSFILSAFFFGLALFSYHTTRVVTPALLISLFLIFYKSLPSKKVLSFFFAVYGLFVFFFIPIATSKDAQIRFLATNDLNIVRYQAEAAKMILRDKEIGAEFAGRIFHNRRLAMLNYENAEKFFYNYLLHFSPEFLFIKGDVPLHHAPGFGMMYFFDLLLLLLGGFAYLVKYRNRRNLILPIWLLLSPIPAAVTWQSPHAVRTEIILPTLQMISALGLLELFLFIRSESRLIYLSATVLSVIIFFYQVGSYLHQYYAHTNIELSKNWLYGRKEATAFTEKAKESYVKVVVSSKVDMPYIFWLFYSKYPPEKLLAEGGTVSGGFAETKNHFDKYEFHSFDFEKMNKTPRKILLVGTPEEFPIEANVLKTIYYLDGTAALKIVGINNQK